MGPFKKDIEDLAKQKEGLKRIRDKVEKAAREAIEKQRKENEKKLVVPKGGTLSHLLVSREQMARWIMDVRTQLEAGREHVR